MAIIQTLDNQHEFFEATKWVWAYNSQFSYFSDLPEIEKMEAIKKSDLLFELLDNQSEETGEDIQLDPIAWMCEYKFFSYSELEKMFKNNIDDLLEHLEYEGIELDEFDLNSSNIDTYQAYLSNNFNLELITTSEEYAILSYF